MTTRRPPAPNPAAHPATHAAAKRDYPRAADHPNQATLQPGEALGALIVRHARINGLPITSLHTKLGTRQLHKTRTVDNDTAQNIAAYFDLEPDTVRHATLDAYPSAVTGDPSASVACADPLGWALTHTTTVCGQCADDNRAWLLAHQTGLAWICERHRRPLKTLCAACRRGRPSFDQSPSACLDHPHRALEPGTGDSAYSLGIPITTHLDLQHRIATKTATHDPADIHWLQNLRALAAIAYADATNGGTSPAHTIPGLRTAHRSIDTVRPTMSGSTPSKVVGPRLNRPPYDPALNGYLLHVASTHISATGQPDTDWIQAVAEHHDTRKLYGSRLDVFTDHLAPTRTFAKPRHVGTHQNWTRAVALLAQQWLDAHRTANHIPATLTLPNEPLFDCSANTSTAFAVLLHEHVSRLDRFRPPTTTQHGVTALYPRRRRATSKLASTEALALNETIYNKICRVVRDRPSRADLDRYHHAVEHALQQPAIDVTTQRAQQRHVTRVNTTVLNSIGLHPPHTAVIDPPATAAIWLWVMATGGHPATAPFVSGAAVRSLLAPLQRWHDQTPPERRLALLDWNAANSLITDTAQTAADAPANPDQGRATTANDKARSAMRFPARQASSRPVTAVSDLPVPRTATS